MEIVFLITYMIIYWVCRLYSPLAESEYSYALTGMLIFALVIVVIKTVFYTDNLNPRRAEIEFAGAYLRRMKYMAPTLVVGMLALYIIVDSPTKNFNGGLREFSISLFIYLFMEQAILFFKQLPFFNRTNGLK